ncbi:hypothetical protein F5880DRAFT_503157 [Lentinula raphanica]|nr:hypothetical protein F5880DRAFT_503157 [Lentinula raphanica]
MRALVLSSSLRTRKVSFQRPGHSNLDVIHELEEQNSDKSFPQVGSQSSSPAQSSGPPLSHSSATSTSETFDDGHRKDTNLLSSGDIEMTFEARFAQDLYGRLLKLSEQRRSTRSVAQDHTSSSFSKRTPSTASRSFVSGLSTSLSKWKRSKSDNTLSFSRSKISSSCDSHPRKRRLTTVSHDVHSPYLTNSPPLKRRRLHSHDATVNSDGYATRPASFRRALSLRSQLDSTSTAVDAISTSSHLSEISNLSGTANFPSPPGWIPTVPCSPEPEIPPPPKSHGLAHIYRDPRLDTRSPSVTRRHKSHRTIKKPSRLIPKVPIIAPPPDHAYSPPLSEASQAKLRLLRFCERESRMRDVDRAVLQEPAILVCNSLPTLAVELSTTAENKDVIEDVEMYIRDSKIDQQDSPRVNSCASSLKSSPRSFHGLGNRIISWILEVSPSQSFNTNTNTNTSSFSSSRTHSRSETSSPRDHQMSFGSMNSSSVSSHPVSTSERLTDLTDQLLNSPETRFHAAYLFVRFFRLIFGAAQGSGTTTKGSPVDSSERTFESFCRKYSWDIEGSELVLWDVAVGCLALSVKLHRDFLPPLFPILSSDYEELAPHDMGYGDLEAAQRDILFTTSYNLGSTPQAILDDLWIALPTLRELLSFDQGWSLVLQETWLILYETVRDPEIMEFSLSVLTAAALIEGVISVLVRHYQSQDPWYEQFRRRTLTAVNRRKGSTGYIAHEGQGYPCTKSTRSLTSSSSLSSSGDAEAGVKDILTMQHVTQGGDEFALRKAKERVRLAKIETKGVCLDVQATLGIPDVSFYCGYRFIRLCLCP